MDRNGWNQPAPGAPEQTGRQKSPFDEPDAAPELRQERSENLYTRDEPFWHRVVEMPRPGEKVRRDPNYWNHPEEMRRDRFRTVPPKNLAERVRRFLGRSVVKKTILVIAVLLVLGALFQSTAFRITTITVQGNSQVSEEEIIRLSGIAKGQNSLGIDEEAVMRRVENNRYLRCTLVDARGQTVVIQVKERVPAASLEHNCMIVTLDNRGYVLETSLDMGQVDSSLVQVEGMVLRRSAPGQQASAVNPVQLEVYTQVLVELKAMQALELLEELDLTNMDSISLTTRDGFRVRMGDSASIHEKLRAFTITRERLLEMGYKTGVIDVTAPARPTYAQSLPEE